MTNPPLPARPRRWARIAVFPLTLLVIEFLDEFVFGAREAAWPLIRDDLGLNYVQIGLLLGVPAVLSEFIEPAFGILADTGRRRSLILGGGVAFAAALLGLIAAPNFAALLLVFIVLYPASGAFVGLSEATLMDLDPTRHDHNMARWTLAGSVGVVVGPLALGVAAWAGLGWRGLFAALAGLTVLILFFTWRQRFPPADPAVAATTFRAGLAAAGRALRRRDVLRWLILLEFADLMLDILLGFLALYFVDVVQVSEAEAGVAVAVWTGVGLLGDALLIPLLERVAGVRYLRLSAAVILGLFPAFLLVPGFWPKLGLVGLLGLFNAGWYAILKGRLYAAMPGQSGTVMTLGNLFGLAGGLIPLALGLLAEQFGLGWALWALLAGPLALLVGLPRGKAAAPSVRD
ncbi:MAG: MFS transporter [Chloroflexota bacterium]|nr:MFS transporter [Chloroflexota bacterium]